MKEKFIMVWRCIVGPEYGFFDDGNEQWYYFLSLVLNIMLILSFEPNIALIFALLAVIHYMTVFIYGYYCLENESVIYSFAYVITHLIIIVIALRTDVVWTTATFGITYVFSIIAPDYEGDSLLKENEQHPLLLNTLVIIVFAIIIFILPISLIIKILIIFGAMFIHPVIDYFEGDGVGIIDVTFDAYSNVISTFIE